MTVSFTRVYTISASHRLHTAALSDEENRLSFGKCNNPHGHGHNYRIHVTVRGPVSQETGMVVNMADLDRVTQERVISRFDHHNLNLDPVFTHLVSTTENLAIVVWDLLHDAFPGTDSSPARLDRIRIEETENNFFEYFGPSHQA